MAKGKPKRLRRIQLAEISTCGVPANQHSRITISKGKELDKGNSDGFTSEVEGHSHAVSIGLTRPMPGKQPEVKYVVLGASAGPDGAAHDHVVALNPDGSYSVGMVLGHTHDLPDIAAIVAARVAAIMGKGEGGDQLLTKATDGHAHYLALDSEGAPVTLASGPDRHTHVIEKGRGGGWQVLRGPDGHTHGLPEGDFTKHLRRDGGTAPALTTTGKRGPDTMTKAKDDAAALIRKAADAEAELERLGKQCAGELGLTYEQGFARVLRTPRGRELWKAMRAPEFAKSAEEVAFDSECEAAIEALLDAETGEWDTAKEIETKRAEVIRKFYDSDQFREIYAKHFSTPLEKAEEPVLQPVALGLLTIDEIRRDPEAALDKLAQIVSWKEGITKAKAYKSFMRRNSIGYDLMRLAQDAQAARSLAATQSYS